MKNTKVSGVANWNNNIVDANIKCGFSFLGVKEAIGNIGKKKKKVWLSGKFWDTVGFSITEDLNTGREILYSHLLNSVSELVAYDQFSRLK